MSTFTMVAQIVKHWFDQSAFYIVNKIKRPKEVLVIVARRDRPPRLAR